MQCNLFLFLCMGNSNSFLILHRQCKFYLFFALAMQILFIFCIGNANSFFFALAMQFFFIFGFGNAIFFNFLLGQCIVFSIFAWVMQMVFLHEQCKFFFQQSARPSWPAAGWGREQAMRVESARSAFPGSDNKKNHPYKKLFDDQGDFEVFCLHKHGTQNDLVTRTKSRQMI